ncbi:hypothetical protein RB2505 [Rhodopirellula baltica SH 1]|uniref:Uncharacterized protein n=1 Tax=Rhodopirellula baltica (strain DSM 10527 / NCIMB 13988 / SH1) TaxID=243090 RepID=Q7UVP6_RHOBA|nr:hypothetical protein RB2505 [Rhodopirellula baltica SH 1]
MRVDVWFSRVCGAPTRCVRHVRIPTMLGWFECGLPDCSCRPELVPTIPTIFCDCVSWINTHLRLCGVWMMFFRLYCWKSNRG